MVLNCGSSSVKYQLFRGDVSLVRGSIERIGSPSCVHRRHGQAELTLDDSTYPSAIRAAVAEVAISGVSIECVGHRVVHGGPTLIRPTLVTEAVLHEIQRCADLAPLHNPSNSQGIQIAAELLAGVPQVACFDTAFHHTIPEKAYRYAIPAHLADAHRIRRYGFHGLSFSYVSSLLTERRVIIAHLGSGCSAAAIIDGHSVDTTMGHTPMEGIVMATRAGDVDAGVVLQLAASMGLGQLSALLNKRSGMLGLTDGISADMKEILALTRGGGVTAQVANEAVDVFVYSVQKKIGQLMAALSFDCDAIVFTGGIGENSAEIRTRVMGCFSALGIAVDKSLNNSVPSGGVISVPRSGCKTKVIVVKTNEELQIARESIQVIRA